MNTPSDLDLIKLPPLTIARFMPMYLHLANNGIIQSCGPTLNKVSGGNKLEGKSFFSLFNIRRPRNITSLEKLLNHLGERLFLSLTDSHETEMRGVAMTDGESGILVNLSFGIGVVDAVRTHSLTDADFSPTDLTIELLYLVEAKTLVFEEFQRLNGRLEDARTLAEEQALTDMLTGLRNRRALDIALKAACRLGRPFSVIHIDLDYFKEVNDTLGHAAGDHVLCEVATVLRSETRSGDVVARIGGDEFVIILPRLVDKDELLSVSNRIISGIGRPISYADKTCSVGASIGVASSIYYESLNANHILNDADKALYKAKHAGRGHAVFWSDLNDAKKL